MILIIFKVTVKVFSNRNKIKTTIKKINLLNFHYQIVNKNYKKS